MDLTNHFLIAMPGMADPHFSKTVTLVCSHDSSGAMGIVINRPSALTLDSVLEQMDIATEAEITGDMPVFHGGPVLQERGFVLHRPIGEWESCLSVSDDIAVATSKDILAAVAVGQGPSNVLVALGYAGWGAGQLEDEFVQNAWLSGPANAEVIFTAPVEQRWQLAAKLLGVDVDRLSSQAGHA
ncbi:MAG: YqgE/AlgH family protein [Gammaproteobacteria bacterium]|nr:YqgE/AlgH family protein [Gammaproteobacteria bacterium]